MDSVALEDPGDAGHSVPDPRPINSPRRKLLRYGLLALVLVGLVTIGWEACYVLLGPNFHVVTPDQAYRSGQPKADWLGRTIDRHGIRSVVNLRGDGHASAWYVNERRVADERGVEFENVMLSASFAPHQRDLRRLIQVLDNAPRPVLFHCRSGGDRSGLTAAIFLLLYTDASLEQARGQLSLRFGHNRYGRSACLHSVLDQYEQWLTDDSREHRPEHLRQWIARVYRLPPPASPNLATRM